MDLPPEAGHLPWGEVHGAEVAGVAELAALPATVGDQHRQLRPDPHWPRRHRRLGAQRPRLTGPANGLVPARSRFSARQAAGGMPAPGPPRCWRRAGAYCRRPRHPAAAAPPRPARLITAHEEDGLLVMGELAPVRVAPARPVRPDQALSDHAFQALLLGHCEHHHALVDEARSGLPGGPASSSASNAARRWAHGSRVSSRPSSHSRSRPGS
jgi:hypothetical protein